MNILQINTVVNRGSTGKIAESIGRMILDDCGHSYIAYSRVRTHAASQSKLIPIGSKWDFLAHVLLTRLLDRHGFGSLKSTKKLIRMIEILEPDIIHLHNIHGYYLNIRLLFDYLLIKEIPVVWTLHDCWAITGHCVHFERLNCNRWKTACFDCPSINSYPRSLFADNSKSNFIEKKKLFSSLSNITLVPVSVWLDGKISDSFLNNKTSKVIHNGVDLELFRVQNKSDDYWFDYLGLPITSKVILAVTNIWTVNKGLDDIIKLYELLPNNYHLVIVGVTDRQKKKLPKGLHAITRTQNSQKLVELYNIASVYINPTYEDNFPTTNIEALACGTPVITYDTGGSPEAIDSETGYVVEKGNVIELSSKIQKVCQLGKDYFKYKCRTRAELLFNKNDRFNDYIELYKEILKTKDVTIQK